MKHKYPSPLDQLLTYGSCLEIKGWPNYLELGFTDEHINDLIQMVLDKELYDSLSDSEEVWAPVHAWRTLGQLKAYSVAEELLELLPRVDERYDDWIGEEIPEVFKMFGPETIPVIQHYIETNNDGEWANITAIHGLELIGNEYPESRNICVTILSSQLKKCEEFEPTYNAFLVSYLVDLKAAETIDIIAKAFEKDVVDLSVMGDFEEVEIALGLRVERSTLPPKFGFFGFDDNIEDEEDHNWFDIPQLSTQVVRTAPKVGRNDPCTCGSGKKYKKCCL